MRRSGWILILCGISGFPAAVQAATATTTFAVTGTVVPTCNISAGALNFGATIPTPVNSNVDAQSTIVATCSSGAPYTVALSAGNGAGATFVSRKMTSGPNTLDYSLFTNTGRTTVWGDGTAGSSVAGATGNGSAQSIVVYGRILSGQSVPTGAYSDTIVATLNF